MSKLDQIRALRERQFAQRASTPVSQAVNNVNNTTTAFEKIEQGLNEALAIARGEAKPAAERQAKWRKANPELNRQRARDGMRKLRANANV